MPGRATYSSERGKILLLIGAGTLALTMITGSILGLGGLQKIFDDLLSSIF